MDYPSASWLSFFGRPSLIAPASADAPARALGCRYRKTALLLAWLAAHAGRPQRRARIAELFWPQVPATVARGNLRVLLNDLAARLAALGLADCLEADRDWLCLRPAGRFVTDEEMLADEARRSAVASPVLERFGQPWLSADGIELEGELAEWLAARQAWFAARVEALLAAPAPLPAAVPPAPTFGGGPSPGEAPPFQPPAALGLSLAGGDDSACWRHVVLLHLILAPESLPAEEKKRHAAARGRCLALAAEAERLGARTLEANATLTLAFGIDEAAAATRWHAWRTALALRRLEPQASIGLCAGTCLVRAGQVFGERIELVRHLALCAEEGEIVADAGFAGLAPCVGAPEARAFRGFAAPVEILRFRSVPACPRPDALLSRGTPFVGRAKELAYLQTAPDAATVCLVAPPGFGKSRLAAQFAQAQARKEVHWIGCRAELASQPWAALYEYLSRPEVRERCDAGPHAVALRQFVAHRHVGFEWRGEMIAALAGLWRGGLVVVDDAHWLDDPCARLFDEVSRRTPAFWLLTRRPQTGGWLPANAALAELPPLDDEAASALLDAAAGKRLPETERRGALARCRGNPLLLLAEGKSDSASAEIAEGIDRQIAFPAAPTRLIGLAALLGQNFRRSELVALIPDAAADETLALAAERRLIVLWNEDQCGFVHPLLRERCLDRLDTAEMQALAAQAATYLSGKREHVRAAELYERSEDFGAARAAWFAAAQGALAEEDASAACAHFARIAALGFSSGAAGEWERIHYARSLVVRDGYGIDAIDQLVGELARRMPSGDDAEAHERHFAANALLYLWSGGASPISGLAQAERLAALARTPSQEYAAVWARANTTLLTGRFIQARRDFARLMLVKLPFVERVRYFPSDPHAFVFTNHAWAGWFLGEAGWRVEIERAVELSLRDALKQDECIARCYAGAIYLCEGDLEALSAHASRSFEIAARESFAFWELFSGLLMQILAAHEGQRPDAARCAGFEAAIRQAYPAGLNTVRWLIAEAHAACRDWPAARALCALAVAEGEKSEHLYCLPDLWRLLGMALAETGEARAGRAALHRAKELALGQRANGWLERWRELLPDDAPSRQTAMAALSRVLPDCVPARSA